MCGIVGSFKAGRTGSGADIVARMRDRMEHREENFLRLVETTVYGYPRSPYLPLLKMAGCELGDLKALVKQKGLEGALRVLRDQGVYVAFEEFKGRQPIVRNGLLVVNFVPLVSAVRRMRTVSPLRLMMRTSTSLGSTSQRRPLTDSFFSRTGSSQ